MIAALKALQLATSIAFTVLVVVVYPGAMLVIPGGVGLAYVAAAALAIADYRIGIWLGFAFSVLAAAFADYGVYRYVRNGFDFLSGAYRGFGTVHWPPYLFLLVAAGATVVVLLHAPAWRWLLRGREGSAR